MQIPNLTDTGQMYFSTRQYPELRRLSAGEQSVVMKAALAAYEPSQLKRFVLALGLALAAGYALDFAVSSTPALEYLGMALTGLSFYGYLLWEINTRTHAAVIRHLASARTAARPEEGPE